MPRLIQTFSIVSHFASVVIFVFRTTLNTLNLFILRILIGMFVLYSTHFQFFSSCHLRWLLNRNTLRWYCLKINVGMWPEQIKRKKHKRNTRKRVAINRWKKVNGKQMATEISSTKPNENHKKKETEKRVENTTAKGICIKTKRRLYHRS